MEDGQAELKIEEPVRLDERTPWQKAEYERKRVSHKKEFKNLCLQHIKLLKRKEAVIDFNRLLDVWQLYIRYKKLEAIALVKHIAPHDGLIEKQLSNIQQIDALLTKVDVKNQELLTSFDLLISQVINCNESVHSNINLLDKQIADIENDMAEEKNKIAMIYDGFVTFSDEYPTQLELAGKDFVHVVQEDKPLVEIDGTITSTLVEKLRQNLLNEAHKFELKIELINSSIQELELKELLGILATKKVSLLQQKTMYEQFNEQLKSKQSIIPITLDEKVLASLQVDFNDYKQTLQDTYNNINTEYNKIEISLELPPKHVEHSVLQLSLLSHQELYELNIFEYRALKQQESVFKIAYRKSRKHGIDENSELENKLIDVREYKKSVQQKISSTYKLRRIEIENTINQGKTAEEIAKLKADVATVNWQKYAEVGVVPDTLLPLPPALQESKFGNEKARNAVIIAVSQAICESLARLALITNSRSNPKTPQEQAGLLYLNDPAMVDLLHKHGESEDSALLALDATRKKICKLGAEINQFIKEIE